MWTSFKTLSMHSVGTQVYSDVLSSSNEPRNACNPHFDDFSVLKHTIFCIIRISTSKIQNFCVDVRQDLYYIEGWPSWPIRSILKVKRSLKCAYPLFQQFSCAIAHYFVGDSDSDVKNTEIFFGCFSRHWQ